METRRSGQKRSVFPMNDPAIALAKARSFCAYQERCQSEVLTRLKSFGLDREQIQKVMDQLVDESFIDDERFAKTYAGSKFRILHWGKVKIKAGLRAKEIGNEYINEALAEIDQTAYVSTLHQLMDVKLRSIADQTDSWAVKQKVAAYLISKGFEENLILQELHKKIKT